MRATNVRKLKRNPSEALREAEAGPVLVLKGDEPHSVLVRLEAELLEGPGSVRAPLAAALFREGTLSLGAAARVSGMPLGRFVRYLGELGVDLVREDETTTREAKDLAPWRR